MRFPVLFAAVSLLFRIILLTSALVAQNTAPEPKSATVPITLDHNRVVIDVYIPLADGTTKRIRGWVDNGNPDLYLSPRATTLMGLNVTCKEGEKVCTAPLPAAITIGEMKVPLSAIKEAKVPLRAPAAAAIMVPGMSAEITLPSTLLRAYDVLVDFPNREFTIAARGTLKFKGVSAKALVNADNGLVQIPSQIESKKYNLALDLGASISFLSDELFSQLSAEHSDWAHMTGAVGPANLWGSPNEVTCRVMRVDRVQFGPLHFTDVPVVNLAGDAASQFKRRSSVPTVGLLGSDALLNYRVGLDYAHSTVYFDLGNTFKFPEFDVVGLTLRPEDDTRFTIIGIVDFEGNPSVLTGDAGVQPGDHLLAVDGIPVPDSTMGQVWSLLEGTAGQERKLTIERGGKQMSVVAHVQHFLGEPADNAPKTKSK